MNAFQTLVLLYCAVSGVLLAVFSPSRRWSKKTKGMSPQDLTDYRMEKTGIGIPRGCIWGMVGVAELAYQYLVEPVYLIWAIFVPVHPLWLAYVALVIVLVKLILLVVMFVVPMPKVDDATSSPFYWIGAVVWASPTLYLWFLLIAMLAR